MFGSSLKRSVVAVSAAIALSGVMVGAAVGPVQAAALQASVAARA